MHPSGVLIACDAAQKPVQSYQQLLRSVREVLQQYEQVAQLSSSHYLVRDHSLVRPIVNDERGFCRIRTANSSYNLNISRNNERLYIYIPICTPAQSILDDNNKLKFNGTFCMLPSYLGGFTLQS